jgi:surfeit locus 1 family protein
LALLLFASLFASLGTWQTWRAGEKLEIEQQHQAAAIVSLKAALAKDQRFAQIDAAGHYDPLRHILLDNQIWQGRAGVHVFTPFYTLDGTAILVNRGWLPIAADRQSLPEIPTTQTEVVLRGMLNIPPVPGRIIGQADKLRQNLWPQLVTYLNLENIARSLNVPLESYVIQRPGDIQDSNM